MKGVIGLMCFCFIGLLLIPDKSRAYGMNPDTLDEEQRAYYDSIFHDSLKQFENELMVLRDTLMESENEASRVEAMRNYIPTLVNALQVPGSIYYPFEELEFMFTHMPEDSTFRLYNWVMEFDDGTHRYYGAIQMNNNEEFQLYPLTDASEDLPDKPENHTLTNENWYGALYYDMLMIEDGGRKYYTLLGWDGYNQHNQLKMVDVLTFDRQGRPNFGAPIFHVRSDDGSEQRKHRVYFEYSDQAVMTLNIADGTEIIIFDQLVPIAGESPMGGPKMVPDGTYSSFVFKNGRWMQTDHPFDVLEELQGEEGP